METIKYLSFYTLIILASLADAGCTLKIQEAAGCNNPGLFGCKDKPVFTENAKDISVLTPNDGREPEYDDQN